MNAHHQVRVEAGQIWAGNFWAFTCKVFNELNPGTSFEDNWHIHVLAEEAMRCWRGETKRLLITVPPRSLKSIIWSIALPAFILGHDPTKRIICVSYSQVLADEFSNGFRQVVNSSWYKSTFPSVQISRASDQMVVTDQRGYRYATSVLGTLTGLGGDHIIIDDILKAEDAYSTAARDRANEFYRRSLYTRQDDKLRACIIVVCQRLHAEDLPGQLIRSGEYRHVNLPARALQSDTFDLGYGQTHHRQEGELLHAEREPQEALEQLERTLGTAAFQAQYQQDPAPEGGTIIKREWLPCLPSPREPEPGDKIVQSWDLALKGMEQNDWSVCITCLIRNNTYFILDVWRGRLEYVYLVQKAVELYRHWKPSAVLIEEMASGTPLMSELKAHHGIHSIGIRPQRDKLSRLMAISPRFQSGQIVLRENAPWLDTFTDELLRFPQSRHDDQVDSLTQLVQWHADRPVGIFEFYF